jgi:hypothetical protein
VKVFSLPALNRSKEAQRRADEARKQAMAMAVLAQTRLAAVRYRLVADEFLVWDEAARDDDLIVKYLSSSAKVGIDSELELVRNKARAMASHINRDLSYANVQASIGRLFNSVGYDAVPREDEAKAVEELSGLVETRYAELEQASFSARKPRKKPSVILGSISGGNPREERLVREGIERVLKSSGMKADDAAHADASLDIRLVLKTSRQGRRPARVLVRAVSPQRAALEREFKTMLSEPVTDEQWRVLGEGAAYRVIPDIQPSAAARSGLRVARTLHLPASHERRLGELPHERAMPLGLKLGRRLHFPATDLASAKLSP